MLKNTKVPMCVWFIAFQDGSGGGGDNYDDNFIRCCSSSVCNAMVCIFDQGKLELEIMHLVYYLKTTNLCFWGIFYDAQSQMQ